LIKILGGALPLFDLKKEVLNKMISKKECEKIIGHIIRNDTY
jgi:hypothetical protein